MLKIKEEVDLKELEKFGFENDKKTYILNNPFNIAILMIGIKDKNIVILHGDTQTGETLYDLIQAGLVEKVEG